MSVFSFAWDGLHHAERLQAGPLGDERGLAARRRLEGEEAGLVFGNVDRPSEADARSRSRQLRGG
jgi:hypothetical protein